MKCFFRKALLMPLAFSCMFANASPIFYEAVDLADTTAGIDLWRYDYTIGNDTPFDLNGFTIFFDFDLYDFNLIESPAGSGEFIVDPLDSTAPLGWDEFVAPNASILGVEEDGFFDIFSALGIAPGDPLIGGFSVIFAFNGSGVPGSQFFEFFGTDTVGNDITGSSFTQLMGGPQPAPEPGILFLIFAGLLPLARHRMRVVS